MASPYRRTGVYDPSGVGAWIGGYSGVPGLGGGRQEWFCTFPAGGEPDAFDPSGTYSVTGTRTSSSASLTTAQLAAAIHEFQLTSNANGEALDALVSENVNGQTLFLDAAGQAAYANIVAWARTNGNAVTPKITGLVTSPAGRPNTTYTATATAAANTTVKLSASGANLGATTVTTNSSGTASFTYSVPSSNTTGNFTISPSVTAYTGLAEASATNQTPSQSQTVTSYRTSTLTSSAAGSVEPLINVTITKLIAGDASKTPQAATFKVVDKTTGQTLTNSFTTLAGTPTPLAIGFTPGNTYVFTETAAPAGAYLPATPFTVTIPTNASDGYAIVLTDPKMPVVSVGTQVNYTATAVLVPLKDNVTLAGDDGEAGTITGNVKFVASVTCAAVTAAQWSAAPVAGTYTTPIVGTFGDGQGNGTYQMTGPTPTVGQAGAWGWFETATLTPSGATGTSPYGAPNECTDVTSPAAKTQVSERYGLVGDPITDTIPVTGVTQTPAGTGPVGTVTAVTYFMPFTSGSMVCPKPGDTAAWATFIAAHPQAAVANQSWPITADGTLKTSGYKATQPGCVTFGETMLLTGTSTPIVLSKPGAVNEAATIVSPTVTTLINRSTTASGSSVSFTDTAKITGTHGVPTTLVDKLVGPASPDAQGVCSNARYDAGHQVGAFAPVTVTKDGTVTTNTLTVAKQSIPLCYLGWESLTIPGPNGKPRTAYTADLGKETAEMALAQAAQAAAASSAGYSAVALNTGYAGGGHRGPAWAIAAGLVLIVGSTAGAGVLFARRRRNSVEQSAA